MSPSHRNSRPNPFPYLGTFRIAGQRLAQGGPAIGGNVKTIQRPAIRKLNSLIRGYLTRFSPQWSGEGGLVVIRGEHGSGKTHMIYAVWQKLTNDTRVFPVYVLQQNPDVLNLYRDVMATVDFPLLKQMSRSLLGAMAAEQLGPTLASDADRQRFTQQLKENPDLEEPGEPIPPARPKDMFEVEGPRIGQSWPLPATETHEKAAALKRIFEAEARGETVGAGAPPPPTPSLNELFDTFRVERGAVTSLQEKTLRQMTQGNANLERAVRHLQGKQFDEQAANWFRLLPVSGKDLDAMGISDAISTPDEAVQALELLAAMFSISNRALLLFVDQYEKLLLDDDPVLAARNVGWIRSLGETLVARNAMLVLSGNEEAWKKLPPDLYQRIELNQVQCPIFTFQESMDVLRIYLTPDEIKFEPGGKTYLAPFTDDGVRTMLELGGGNPRRLLQYAWSAFQEAVPGQAVDAAFVGKIARESADQFVDVPMVRRDTERYLRRQPYRLAQGFAQDNMKFDFALLDPRDEAVLLLDVRGAIFRDDEAANALITAGTLARLRASGSRATYALVATGYVSPEIVDTLAQVVTHLIVYKRTTFESQIADLMTNVPRTALPSAPAAGDTSEQFDQIRELLAKLGESRGQQTVIVNQRSDELAASQERQRYDERREQTRREWSEERRKIEADISRVRKERIDAGMAELRTSRRRERRNRITLNVCLGLLIGVAIWWAWIMNDAGAEYRPMNPAWGLAVAACALIAIFLNESFFWTWFHVPSEISGMSELEQLALRRTPWFVSPSLLFQRDPLIRFLTKAAQVQSGYDSVSDTLSLIATEPLRVLRQALCRVFINWLDPDKEVAVHPRLLHISQDLRLLLEHRGIAKGMQKSPGLDSPEDLLCTLATKQYKGVQRMSLDLAMAAGGGDSDSPIVLAFHEGLDRSNLARLGEIRERELREAVREWSPFEEGGLGTLYYLQNAKLTEQVFLVAAQVLRYFEHDLLDVPPASQPGGGASDTHTMPARSKPIA